MKKFIYVLIILVACSIPMFAQTDSTTVNTVIAEGLWGFISNLIVKYSWITYVITGLFFLSEILGNIAKVKANSIYQLITNFISYFYKKSSSK
jgi:hypothetical protein